MQQQIIRETFHLVSKRDDNVCNFLEGGRQVLVSFSHFHMNSLSCFTLVVDPWGLAAVNIAVINMSRLAKFLSAILAVALELKYSCRTVFLPTADAVPDFYL